MPSSPIQCRASPPTTRRHGLSNRQSLPRSAARLGKPTAERRRGSTPKRMAAHQTFLQRRAVGADKKAPAWLGVAGAPACEKARAGPEGADDQRDSAKLNLIRGWGAQKQCKQFGICAAQPRQIFVTCFPALTVPTRPTISRRLEQWRQRYSLIIMTILVSSHASNRARHCDDSSA